MRPTRSLQAAAAKEIGSAAATPPEEKKFSHHFLPSDSPNPAAGHWTTGPLAGAGWSGLLDLSQEPAMRPPEELARELLGLSRAKSASRSLRRALLMQWVNAGSRYRCGKRT